MTTGLTAVPTASSAARPLPTLLIRPGTAADLPAITAIYADAVAHGTASFEIDVPDTAEMARRHADVAAKGLPWLVAQAGAAGSAAGIVGYAYAGPFRPRPAYRHTLENSVYLHADARGRGIGRLLMVELIARVEALGARQMTAVIGDSGNAASIALHRALGFAHVGTLANVGRKFDRWLDVVLMQRTLGTGAGTAPSADRLAGTARSAAELVGTARSADNVARTAAPTGTLASAAPPTGIFASMAPPTNILAATAPLR